jgi:hypothetical protein
MGLVVIVLVSFMSMGMWLRMMAMGMAMTVIVRMTSRQEKGTDNVHGETDRGDDGRFGERHCGRLEEAN